MQRDTLSVVSIPIMIGVTGHRYLDPRSASQAAPAVRRVLQEILDSHPNSSIMLLNGLAIGADTLVAKVALEMERVQLVGALPMPLEEYRKDFSEGADLEEFERLLEAADHWFEIPQPEAGSIDINDPQQRARCYELLAEYLARYSQYAIALWDGLPSRGGGSTAELVNIVLTGTADPEGTRGSIHEPASAGPVIHIQTARSGEPERRQNARVRMLYPNRDRDDLEEERMYRSTLDHIEKYNQDLAGRWQQLQLDDEKLNESLQCPPQLADDASLKDVRMQFAAADGLAVLFKRLHRQALFWLIVQCGLGYTCLELYDEVFSAYTWGSVVLLGFPLAMAMAWLRLSSSRLWHTKYLNYRGLAEAVRIQYYWDIAGLGDEAHDYYLSKHQSELRWVRWALQAWRVPTHEHQILPPDNDREMAIEQLRFVYNTWIFRQSGFFGMRAHARQRDISNFNRWRMLLFYGAVTGSLLLFFVHIVLHAQHASEASTGTIQSRFILVIGMLFVVGGLISHYAEKLSYNDELHQYISAHDVFREGSRQIDKLLQAGDAERARAVIREIGLVALQENGDWVRLHSLKAPDLPSS